MCPRCPGLNQTFGLVRPLFQLRFSTQPNLVSRATRSLVQERQKDYIQGTYNYTELHGEFSIECQSSTSPQQYLRTSVYSKSLLQNSVKTNTHSIIVKHPRSPSSIRLHEEYFALQLLTIFIVNRFIVPNRYV